MDSLSSPLKRPTARITKPSNSDHGLEYSTNSETPEKVSKGDTKPVSETLSINSTLKNINNSYKKSNYTDKTDNGEREISIKKLPRPFSSTSGSISHIANHYNSLRELGKILRNESEIYYVRQYNNWVKSVMIQQAASLFNDQKVK